MQPCRGRPAIAVVHRCRRWCPPPESAAGYVVKARAGSELLTAVEGVRQGVPFVSSGSSGHVPAELADVQAPNRLHRDEALTSPAEAND